LWSSDFEFVTALYGQVSLLFMGMPPTIQMANLGMADSLILMVMALVVFGPRRLPQIGRQIGKLMYEFRKASNDFKYQMEEELRLSEEADRRKKDEERLKALTLQSAVQQPAALLTPSTTIEATTPSTTATVSEAEKPIQAEPRVEDTYPRILPPSTGEQVPAARPNGMTALVQTAQDEPDKEQPAAFAESTSVKLTTSAPPEQAVPHG
jgi:sec-independent protein translocase protein TatB